MSRGPAPFPPGDVPEGLRRAVAAGPLPAAQAATWLDRLPTLVSELLASWGLRPAGGPRHGHTSLALPVLRAGGEAAVLKVAAPRPAARQEHLALRAWAGRPVVRLLAADPARWALLLHPLDPDRSLSHLPVLDACEAVGLLVRGLDRPAPPWAPPLSRLLLDLADTLDTSLRGGRPTGLPRRLLQVARAAALEQAGLADVDARLVHVDLHPAGVLWSVPDGRWTALAPRPMAAHPGYALLPTLTAGWPGARDADDTRRHLGLRLDVIAAAAGLDVDRARTLTLVRAVAQGLAATAGAAGGAGAARASGAAATQEVTRAVTVAKAMLPE